MSEKDKNEVVKYRIVVVSWKNHYSESNFIATSMLNRYCRLFLKVNTRPNLKYALTGPKKINMLRTKEQKRTLS